MPEIVLFHHAQGLTAGCLSFADELRAAGHGVHAPDLYEGRTFTELADGLGYAEEVGFDTIIERGRRAAAELRDDIVYAGLSLGVMPAHEWGDVDVAREMAETDYDESATALVLGRVRSFLDGIE